MRQDCYNGAMLRIGIIGLGRHGRRYADHLARGDVPGARLAGFWRRDQAQAALDAQALGAPACPTPAALLAASDAVVITVPAAEHEGLATAAAEAGKPTLIEKPLARTVAEGSAIAAAFEARGGQLMVAQTLRFDPLTRALGAHAAGRVLVGFDLEQRLEPRGLAWELDPTTAGGGVLIQTGIHGLDKLRFLTGAPVELLYARLDHVLGNATEDQALVCLRVAGRTGVLRTSKIGGSRHHRTCLYFEDGGAEADYIARTFTVITGRTRTTTAVPEEPTVRAVLAAFVGWARGERADCPVPPREALEAVRVVEAAYQSARDAR
jgi:predicted dehydrogenase